MRRLAVFLAFSTFVASGVLLLSCTTGSLKTATVRLPPNSISTVTPRTRVDYGCYLISVTGPGVTPTASSNDLGSYSPDCLGVGIYSNLVSYDDLTGPGVRLKLPAGRQRTIKVYGVATYLDSCRGKPASALFENSLVPELYTLAESAPVDLLTDAKVEVRQSVPTGAEVNLLSSCFKTDPKPIPPSDVNAVRILATYATGIPLVDVVELGLTDGSLTLRQTVTDGSLVQPVIAVSPDDTRVVVWSPSSLDHRQYAYEYPGTLNAKTDSLPGHFFDDRTSFFFSPNGQFLLLWANQFSFLKAVSGPFGINPPGTAAAGSIGRQLFIRNGKLYQVFGGTGTSVGVSQAAFPDSGSWDTQPFFPSSPFTINDAEASTRSVVTEDTLYLLYSSNTLSRVRTLKFQGDGTLLNPSTNDDPVVANFNVHVIRMAYAPVQKKMAVLHVAAGASTLAILEMNADTTVSSSTVATIMIANAYDVLVDPSSRYLIVPTSDGVVSTLKTYSLSDTGELELKTSLGMGVGINNIATLRPR